MCNNLHHDAKSIPEEGEAMSRQERQFEPLPTFMKVILLAIPVASLLVLLCGFFLEG